VKTVAIVQARMGSLRLPGKVLRKIGNLTSIERQFERLGFASTLDSVVLATTQLEQDDQLASFAESKGWNLFRGAAHDVLTRYIDASLEHKADLVVRITGDCPLIDAGLIDEVVQMAATGDELYFSNIEPPTYPNGLDVEVFPISSLLWASENTPLIEEREHVTTQLRKSPQVEKRNLAWSRDLSGERWTLDTQEDLQVLTSVFEAFGWRNDFSWLEVMELRNAQPNLFEANRHLPRNHGLLLTNKEKSSIYEQGRSPAS
jgi:glutamate-1-semialdehyde 2,1-aminomutase